MITVTITLADLIERGACPEGIDLFKVRHPDGIASIEWSVENQMTLLFNVSIGDRRDVTWLISRGLLPPYSLQGCKMYGRDFHASVITAADFRQADLRTANMRNVVANRASFLFADLRGADCRGANFTGADLTNANLSNIITDENTKGLPS